MGIQVIDPRREILASELAGIFNKKHFTSVTPVICLAGLSPVVVDTTAAPSLFSIVLLFVMQQHCSSLKYTDS